MAGGHLLASPGSAAAGSLPDLVITALIFPARITAGQAIRFGVTVKNQGRAATPAHVIVGATFYVDGHEMTWSDTDNHNLAPGARATFYANTGPRGSAWWGASAGRHTLKAVVNASHRFPESNTNNNSRSAVFVVGPSVARGKPVNTGRPVISGTARVGDVLRTTHGTWS